VSPVEHIKVQAVIQKYVDSSISKTINMPNNSTVQDVMDAYMLAYTLGCKGCTVYRDGCRDDQVLTKAEVKPSIVTANTKDLDRGVWKKKAPDTKYYPVKVYIGCGKLKLLIGWSDIEQSIQDMYVIRTGSGGCECNLQGMVISMSGMLRLGGDIFNIEKAFTGMSTCNSFTAKRAKGQGKLSPGSNCGTAILLALKEFISRVKTDEVSVAATSEYVKDATTCPICGKYLVRSGCWKCPNCGFEKCE
jgi:ribonucleoside-diphosphate reductase alpha chain